MKMPRLSPVFQKVFRRAGPASLGLSMAVIGLTSCTTEEGVIAGALAGAAIGGVIGHANEEHDKYRYRHGGYYNHGYYQNDYYDSGRPYYRPGRAYYRPGPVYYRPGPYRHYH